MSLVTDLISNKLETNEKLGLYRKIPEAGFSDKNTPHFLNYNTETVNLATNDYLGLSQNERIKNATKEAVNIYGTSASSSFLIGGHSALHRKLEEKLCKFKGGYEKCLLYPSGYQANIGIIRSLSNLSPLKTFITFDELSHASIIDGILASGVKFKSFKHNDLYHLADVLDKHKNYEIKIVITEGVFSMDGDIPDLPGILNLSKKYGALSIIDDAHATGTIGNKGGGSVDFHNMKPDIIIGTLGKALASNGAFVISSRLIIEYFINFSRPFIFSTGIPPSSAAASLEALNMIGETPEIIHILQNNSEFARGYLRKSGLDILNSSTHIIPVLIGDEKKAILIEKKLLEADIYIKAVRYPTVPKNSARLRLGINAGINKEALKNALKKLLNIIAQTC